MRLIENWRTWWRLWSVRLTALGTALQSLFLAWPDIALTMWNMMPGEVKALLPQQIVFGLPLAFFAAAMIARVVKQPKLETSDGG